MAYNRDSFIEKANSIHNNKYTYEKVVFTRVKDKMIITCPHHGDFIQRGSDHFSGNGCPECVGKKRYTQESFIEKVQKIHPTLNFSKVVFTTTVKKVQVICEKHGEFEIPGDSLIQGRGCPKCSFEKSGEKRQKSQDQFLDELREIYGDQYDYSLVNYQGIYDKVKLICKDHGEFEQSPSNLLHCKSGCPICGRNRSAKKRKMSLENFIQRANEFHSNKYNYSEVYDFKNGSDPIIVICPIHGKYQTTPYKHLQYECDQCGYEKSSKTHIENETIGVFKRNAVKYPELFEGRNGVLYFIRIRRFGEEFLKVGYTERTTEERIKGIHHLEDVEIIDEFKSTTHNILLEEINIHDKYKDMQFIPSKEFGGWKECFSMDALEDIKLEFIKLKQNII